MKIPDERTQVLNKLYEAYLRRVDHIVEFYAGYTGDQDTAIIYTAYEVAKNAHSKQFRHTGEPYIVHPVAVAEILTEIHVDKETLVAAFLHDTVEDTELTLDEIRETFGDNIALLVDGVTKLSQITYSSREEQQAQNFRKMFLAMAKDIRVVLIKLSDRLHNMRTMKYKKPQRRQEISNETLEIYAPLAGRLGIYRLKWELEDLCLRYTDPDGYYDLVGGIAHNRHEREAFLEDVVVDLNDRVAAMGIKAEIEARPKHFYSIYRKMKTQNKTLDEIYDLLACRIIVQTVGECYAVLGMVHELYPPLPGRFKDYIAMPKGNNYQSLHTTVIGPSATPFEVQIRTYEMHMVAEYGIAAHWRYKEGVKGKQDSLEQRLNWLRQLLEWSNDMSEASDYLDSLKEGLVQEEVFIFTPAGDVLSLPAGAVPIDFAYHIHSEVGHKTTGAKVNGRMVPLDYKLKNGDICEIITSDKVKGPSRDWLSIVASTTAKNKIRAWFKKSMRSENIVRGKEALSKRAKREGFGVEILHKPYLQSSLDKYSFSSPDDLFAALGYGGISLNRCFPMIKDSYLRQIPAEKREELGFYLNDKGKIVKMPELKVSEAKSEEEPIDIREEERPAKKSSEDKHHIKVRGMSNCLVNLAKCCNPLPGDEIIGFITRGTGVTVHRKDCHNIRSIEKRARESRRDAERAARLVEVSWGSEDSSNIYEVMLTIYARDRSKLLSDITMAIAEEQIPIVTGRMYSGGPANARFQMLIQVQDQDQLNKVCERIMGIEGVRGIERGA